LSEFFALEAVPDLDDFSPFFKFFLFELLSHASRNILRQLAGVSTQPRGRSVLIRVFEFCLALRFKRHIFLMVLTRMVNMLR